MIWILKIEYGIYFYILCIWFIRTYDFMYFSAVTVDHVKWVPGISLRMLLRSYGEELIEQFLCISSWFTWSLQNYLSRHWADENCLQTMESLKFDCVILFKRILEWYMVFPFFNLVHWVIRMRVYLLIICYSSCEMVTGISLCMLLRSYGGAIILHL